MEKSIVNVGDNIWYRRSMLNERTIYGRVINVENYCIVTVRTSGGGVYIVNLCAIKGYWKDNGGKTGPAYEYIWGKSEPLIKKYAV